MKSNYVGTVKKIRVLKMYPNLLVRFSLVTHDETINCIASKKNIAHKLLMISDGTELAVYGHESKKRQLVIDKLSIRRSLITI